ncbi:alternaria stem canker resistance protein 1-like [Nicotiana sylvestris]|uniref:Protein ASC1-like n=1 Tax=Nicotiana sylvestris TaxID=4096 RepID=A0A1U7VEQ3_NICSY|nr:PREDICTED: protein ASC1-like [Nicotiana sylvestris]XP_009766542.1 PREDICTED: protein ASC1-like [Nicotiana sylvestris]
MKKLYQAAASVDWEKESYPEYKDLNFLIIFALFFPIVRFILDRFVFEALAKRMIFGNEQKLVNINGSRRRRRRRRINKFKESAWKLVYFLSAEILALVVTCNEPWFTNTRYFWSGPGDLVWPDLKMKLKLKGLYMYAGGFYLYSIFALLYWETRRKDFAAQMVHHITTVSLIVLSYIFGLTRVGSVILAIHDGSDVFMEIAKMSRYSGFQRIADIFFIIFAVAFASLRIICFPFWVLRSTCYEILFIVDTEKNRTEGTILYFLFNSLLVCLLVLHIFWMRLILRMVNDLITKGHITDDVRSDSESDDEHKD